MSSFGAPDPEKLGNLDPSGHPGVTNGFIWESADSAPQDSSVCVKLWNCLAAGLKGRTTTTTTCFTVADVSGFH